MHGVWVRGHSDTYWGGGKGGKKSCKSCCFVCYGGRTLIINLNARSPKPAVQSPSRGGIIWRLKNFHKGPVNLKFYSRNRDVTWPKETKVYVMRDNKLRQYSVDCIEGQTVCYGAWERGDRSSYLGSGYGGEQACKSCCTVCDGKETQLLSLKARSSKSRASASKVQAAAKPKGAAACRDKRVVKVASCPDDGHNAEETKLLVMINRYRRRNGLSAVAASASLAQVANRHVRDLQHNIGKLTHGCSDCRYDGGEKSTYPCMWRAPQRLKTAYRGNGYENAHGRSSFKATAESALEAGATARRGITT